jgi:hypothetical protein
MNETAKIILTLLGLASVGMLVATVAKANDKVAGTVEREGTAVAGNGQSYQWRVVVSVQGATDPYTGQAKHAGFGTWDANTIVAMGTTPGEVQGLIEDHLAGLA